tara:strand:+ start:3559 stop:4437 length:879 start_codon:yes stop_codon:yes gene_type:complete
MPTTSKFNKPSVYNMFMVTEVARIKTENPGIPHKEAFAAAGGEWKDNKGTYAPSDEHAAKCIADAKERWEKKYAKQEAVSTDSDSDEDKPKRKGKKSKGSTKDAQGAAVLKLLMSQPGMEAVIANVQVAQADSTAVDDLKKLQRICALYKISPTDTYEEHKVKSRMQRKAIKVGRDAEERISDLEDEVQDLEEKVEQVKGGGAPPPSPTPRQQDQDDMMEAAQQAEVVKGRKVNRKEKRETIGTQLKRQAKIAKDLDAADAQGKNYVTEDEAVAAALEGEADDYSDDEEDMY